MSSVDLVAVVGSLRAESFNRAVFQAAVELVAELDAGPGPVTLVEHDLRAVPFYDGDLEAAGWPEPVAALRERLAAADGLVIFTPEYNRGVPAVVKNAVDWLSRVMGDNALTTTAAGVVAATPGRHGAEGVRAHLADSLTLITPGWYPTSHAVSSIRHVTTDGRLSDPEARAALAQWLTGFVEHCRRFAAED